MKICNRKVTLGTFEILYITKALAQYDGDSMWDTVEIIKIEEKLKKLLK